VSHTTMLTFFCVCTGIDSRLLLLQAPDGVRNCFQQRSRWTKVSAAPAAITPTGAVCWH
jgi:hypothetical protein